MQYIVIGEARWVDAPKPLVDPACTASADWIHTVCVHDAIYLWRL